MDSEDAKTLKEIGECLDDARGAVAPDRKHEALRKLLKVEGRVKY